MKVTKQQIRELIKEELQNVLNKKQQLNESPVALAVAALTGMGELDSPNGTDMPSNIESVLQTIHDSGPKGEKAVEFIASYAQNGLFSDTDGDGKINIKTPYPDYNDVLDQFAGSVLDTDAPSKPDAGSKTMQGGNIKAQLVSLQTAVDAQNLDNQKKLANMIKNHPQFDSLSLAQKTIVNKLANM